MKSIRYCVLEAARRVGVSPIHLQRCLDAADGKHPGQALHSHALDIHDDMAEELIGYFAKLLVNNDEFQKFCRELAASCGGDQKRN